MAGIGLPSWDSGRPIPPGKAFAGFRAPAPGIAACALWEKSTITFFGVYAMATWTDDDFRIVFSFFRDIRCLLDDEKLYRECRELLKGECEEASRRFSRISDAVSACR